MIDNYDSFVNNLARYFTELGETVMLIRNDEITPDQISAVHLDGIIISPGPKSPKDCGISKEIVAAFADRIPILGVCLGHQIIGDIFGGKVQKGRRPMHGKVSRIENNQTGLFSSLPPTYLVTRYHSLIVNADSLPVCLKADAFAEDGTLMALHHKDYPVYGVQFHPEAVMTEYGHELIQNFITLSKEWRKTKNDENNHQRIS